MLRRDTRAESIVVVMIVANSHITHVNAVGHMKSVHAFMLRVCAVPLWPICGGMQVGTTAIGVNDNIISTRKQQTLLTG